MASRDKKLPEKRDDSSNSEFMQRLKTRPILFIGSILILVLIVIAFVVMPAIVPGTFQEFDFVFGSYNRTPIRYTYDNYFHESQIYHARRYESFGIDMNDINVLYMVWRQAFEDTVVYMGILDEMKQAGYSAPEDVVDREVALNPRFQENGRFSAARYRAMDNNARLNLWRQTQDNIAVGYYYRDMGGLKISSAESAFAASMSTPRRSFDMVSFSADSYPDTDVVSYAMANPGLFTQVHHSIITISTNEREAQQIYNTVRDGTMSFEEAARNNSHDSFAERGGDMGIRTAHEYRVLLSDDLSRERVINLSQGTMSDLIRTPGGWVFFRANQAPRPVDLGDELQLMSIRDYIIDNMRGRIEDWLLMEAANFVTIAETIGFNEAAMETGLMKQTFGPIPVNYGNTALFTAVANVGIPELSGAGSNTFFWEMAFSTPINTISAPLVVGNNVIVLYPIEESHLEDFEISDVAGYYPVWVRNGFDAMNQGYFLNNIKLDNRFDETFSRLWGIY